MEDPFGMRMALTHVEGSPIPVSSPVGGYETVRSYSQRCHGPWMYVNQSG